MRGGITWGRLDRRGGVEGILKNLVNSCGVGEGGACQAEKVKL